jgi:hypothetical protein
VAAGYLSVTESVNGRPTSLTPKGLTALRGTADDTLKLRGPLVGAWASYAFGERFPLRLRLGAGALFGSILDERDGTFGSVAVGSYGTAAVANFVYVAPAVRAGFRLAKHVEVSAGVEALVLIGLSQPVWDKRQGIDVGQQGIAYYGADALTGRTFVVIAPGAGARYDF